VPSYSLHVLTKIYFPLDKCPHISRNGTFALTVNDFCCFNEIIGMCIIALITPNLGVTSGTRILFSMSTKFRTKTV
jgi:hypothetical protein